MSRADLDPIARTDGPALAEPRAVDVPVPFDSLDHSHPYILSYVGGRLRALQRQFHWDVSILTTSPQPPVG